jgi:hypothetical protein
MGIDDHPAQLEPQPARWRPTCRAFAFSTDVHCLDRVYLDRVLDPRVTIGTLLKLGTHSPTRHSRKSGYRVRPDGIICLVGTTRPLLSKQPPLSRGQSSQFPTGRNKLHL